MSGLGFCSVPWLFHHVLDPHRFFLNKKTHVESQSSSVLPLLSSEGKVFRDLTRTTWNSSASLLLVIAPPILNVRARPFGLSARLGARGLCLPRALPPKNGISYAVDRKRKRRTS